MEFLSIARTDVIWIEDALCLLHGAGAWHHERRTIEIRAGRIAALHSTPAAPGAGHGDRVVDGHDFLAVPGLVNAHTHSPDNLLRGSVPQLPLELWSLHSAAGRERLQPRDCYVAAALGGIEMLRTGVTSLLDHVRISPDIDLGCLDAVAQAYADLGLRAVVAPIVADRSVAETLPLVEADTGDTDLGTWGQRLPLPAAEQIAISEAFADLWHGRDGITVGAGPSAPQRCSDALLLAAAEMAERRDLVLHMHLLETRAQRALGRRMHAPGTLRHLVERGVVTPRTTFAHAIWLDPGDIALLARTGAAVVHNPVSNVRLGSGVCDLPGLLEAGIRVALGTDSACCNDANDMLETTKWATLLHTLGTGHDRWVDAGEALRLAVFGGADALALRDVRGLTPGAAADLVLLSLDGDGFVPLHDPVRQIVLSQGGRAVRHAFVAGRHALDDGRITGLDAAAIRNEARAIADRRRRDTRDDYAEADLMRRPIESMLRRIAAEDAGS